MAYCCHHQEIPWMTNTFRWSVCRQEVAAKRLQEITSTKMQQWIVRVFYFLSQLFTKHSTLAACIVNITTERELYHSGWMSYDVFPRMNLLWARWARATLPPQSVPLCGHRCTRWLYRPATGTIWSLWSANHMTIVNHEWLRFMPFIVY